MDSADIVDQKNLEIESDTAVPKDKVSEYDSAEAESCSENEENVKNESEGSDNADHSQSEGGSSFNLEREEGDGQESVPNKKVDDDEDKKNPQYIPKRGTFYEHDDRTAEEIAEEQPEEEEEKEKDGKKKVWQEKKEKWSHDRFSEPEQAPKSRAELIAIYGYDIRNEEGPPRARRRRKYGRGPNKYTRNWEDEDAYSKTVKAPVKKNKKPISKQNREEFPPLINNQNPNKNNDLTENEQPYNQTKKIEGRDTYSKDNFQTSKSDNSINETNEENYNKNYPSTQTVRPAVRKEPNESEYHGFTNKIRGVRNRKVPLPVPKNKPRDDFIQSQNFSNRNNQELEKNMSKLNLEEGGKSNYNKNVFNNNNNGNHQRQASVPPRLQSEQKGSKRYSSIRQKSLPETNTPPISNYQHGPTFYPNEYNQQSGPSSNPPLIHQNTQMLSSNTQVAHVAPLQPTTLSQVPVNADPILQAATFAPQAYPQPPSFIQSAAVAGPTFIPPPPQTTQLINFVPSQPAFQPNYQGFQQPFNSVTPPTELYQPQGGITYYSTDQQLAQRQAPQKRPKAAIPIVAPPSFIKKDDSNQGNSQLESMEDIEVQQ